MQNRRLKLLLGIAMVAIGLFIVGRSVYRLATNNDSSTQQSSVNLPQENRQLELTGGYLYATNQPLSEFLPNTDLFFKVQGLTSDRQGEMFEYPDEASGEGQALETCVEFKYFQNSETVARLTLIPKDPSCFTDDQVLINDISALDGDYRYIYAIKVDHLEQD